MINGSECQSGTLATVINGLLVAQIEAGLTLLGANGVWRSVAKGIRLWRAFGTRGQFKVADGYDLLAAGGSFLKIIICICH